MSNDRLQTIYESLLCAQINAQNGLKQQPANVIFIIVVSQITDTVSLLEDLMQEEE
jgi:hypothetical protein